MSNVTDYLIKINNVDYKNNLDEDLKIDRTNLDHEFEVFAQKYAYYGTLAEIAASKEDKLKYSLEILYAQLDAEKRGEAQSNMAQNPKFKYTETMYENEVKGDKRYQVAMEEYLNAKELANKLMVASRSFQSKMESLKHFSRIDMGGNADNRVYNEQTRNAITSKR